MNKWVFIVIWGGIVLSLIFKAEAVQKHESANLNGKFQNSEINYQSSIANIWNIAKEYWRVERNEAVPRSSIPVAKLTHESLTANEGDAIYRLGHSTLLIKLNQKYILIDPVFSERASPVQWAGPKRFHQPPISIEDLPNIQAVVISHDHYDHLDKAAVVKLAGKVELFFTPLKVGQYLREWGVPAKNIVEFDWWQSQKIAGINITATPAQHFSGRGLFDKDQSLWASWVIEYNGIKLFYSGDSGYFSGFKEIGQRFGSFDYTMIETGAYNKLWREIHMTPEQSLQAHLDLNGKYMLPVHNGTFDLALHDWFEPFERIHNLAQQQNVSLLTPIFGEAVLLSQPSKTSAWWRELMKTPLQQSSLLTLNRK